MIPQVNDTYIMLALIGVGIMILYPIVLATIARIRLGVSWRFFWLGVLVFVLFQLISRVPLTVFIQSQLGEILQSSQIWIFAWLIISSITAGLFEEIGRYVGYRFWIKSEQRTWRVGVMYGLGHGGIEAMLLVAGLSALSLINLMLLPTLPSDMLSAEQSAVIAQQITAINEQPVWIALAGAWERLWMVPIHVFFSLVVLQVFRRSSIIWLWVSVGLHALTNMILTGVQMWMGNSGVEAILVVEGLAALIGIGAIIAILKLRTADPVVEEIPDDMVHA